MAVEISNDAIGASLLTTEGLSGTVGEVSSWLRARREARSWSVAKVRLDSLDGWALDKEGNRIVHRSGRFFQIEGRKTAGFDGRLLDTRPVLVQREIGILGCLGNVFDGVLHVLLQDKLEPGNIGGAQLSPTLQATRSNYDRVHGGTYPPFLEPFLETTHPRLYDQLQSEQSWCYDRKRNRNVVLLDHGQGHAPDGYIWVTLGQLRSLVGIDHSVNMCARSVLGTFGLSALPAGRELQEPLRASLSSPASAEPGQPLAQWIVDAKARQSWDSTRCGLRDLPEWEIGARAIEKKSGSSYSIGAVQTEISGREVTRWTQPVVLREETGLVATAATVRNGAFCLLFRAAAAYGGIDNVEISPPLSVESGPPDHIQRALSESLRDADPDTLLLDVELSEEGGRFFQVLNRYRIVLVPPDAVPPLNGDYRWLSLYDLSHLGTQPYFLSMEARSLLAGIDLLELTKMIAQGACG